MAKKAGSERLLTEAELELMNVLWDLGGGTVRDVVEKLPHGRDLAYTSVATFLRILEQKGVLRSEKRGRGLFYEPLLERERHQALALDRVVGRVFDGDPAALLRRLVDSRKLTRRDIERLRAALDGRDEP